MHAFLPSLQILNRFIVAILLLHLIHIAVGRFRAFVPLTSEMLRSCFDETIEVYIPKIYYVREALYTFLNCLTC